LIFDSRKTQSSDKTKLFLHPAFPFVFTNPARAGLVFLSQRFNTILLKRFAGINGISSSNNKLTLSALFQTGAGKGGAGLPPPSPYAFFGAFKHKIQIINLLSLITLQFNPKKRTTLPHFWA
jgi:hypothetical protein